MDMEVLWNDLEGRNVCVSECLCRCSVVFCSVCEN